ARTARASSTASPFPRSASRPCPRRASAWSTKPRPSSRRPGPAPSNEVEMRKAVPLAALTVAAAGAVGAGAVLSDEDRRNQLERQLRVWRLTARRGFHWGIFYLRGRRADEKQRAELGDDPMKLFLDWDPEPIAAASIGQVHKAVLHDGREVAVKVQYPGIDKAIKGDLDNAEMLYGLFASFALKNMDVKALVDELRARMADELDYRLEARLQQEFADRYRGHPFIHVPDVVAERSAQRVMTSEWVDGLTWAQFEEQASDADKQRASEILFRFAEGSIWHH